MKSAEKRNWHAVSSHFAKRDLHRVGKCIAIQNVRDGVAHVEHEHAQATVILVRAGAGFVGRLTHACDGCERAIDEPDDVAKADTIGIHLQKIAAIPATLAFHVAGLL